MKNKMLSYYFFLFLLLLSSSSTFFHNKFKWMKENLVHILYLAYCLGKSQEFHNLSFSLYIFINFVCIREHVFCEYTNGSWWILHQGWISFSLLLVHTYIGFNLKSFKSRMTTNTYKSNGTFISSFLCRTICLNTIFHCLFFHFPFLEQTNESTFYVFSYFRLKF